MQILLLDTETSPNTVFCWGLFDQNIGLSQLIESSRLLCYAAKWYGDDTLLYDSEYQSSPENMLHSLWALLNTADVVIHYNGSRFDIPVIYREFLKYRFSPPSPFKQVDLYKVAKDKFRFASNKLDYVSQYLGLGKKMPTDFTLWVQCMNNDPVAWAKMEKYNKQDVVLLEKVYDRMRPWITNHPNVGAYKEDFVCSACGSHDIQQRGFYVSSTRKYKRFVCNSCGHWDRAILSEKPTRAVLTNAI